VRGWINDLSNGYYYIIHFHICKYNSKFTWCVLILCWFEIIVYYNNSSHFFPGAPKVLCVVVTLECNMKHALTIVVCWFSQTVSWTWTWRNAWIARPTWRPCGGGTARVTICATRAACTTGSTEWIGRRSGLRRRKPPRYDTTRQTDYDYTYIILMYYHYAGIL